MTGSTKQNKPFILGVAGGSGSGKTFFARALHAELGVARCEILYQDNFYIDQSKRFDFDGGSVNFDHPDAIDFPLLTERLFQLKNGRATDIPIYDFVTHSRLAKVLKMEPKPVIVVDGILIFHWAPLRALFDELVFFDTPEALRFQRRLERDVKDRGRTAEGVKQQFLAQVKPMHDKFVEPSKHFAHRVIKDTGEFPSVLQEYCTRLRES